MELARQVLRNLCTANPPHQPPSVGETLRRSNSLHALSRNNQPTSEATSPASGAGRETGCLSKYQATSRALSIRADNVEVTKPLRGLYHSLSVRPWISKIKSRLCGEDDFACDKVQEVADVRRTLRMLTPRERLMFFWCHEPLASF
jgi:hypothetical protein